MTDETTTTGANSNAEAEIFAALDGVPAGDAGEGAETAPGPDEPGTVEEARFYVASIELAVGVSLRVACLVRRVPYTSQLDSATRFSGDERRQLERFAVPACPVLRRWLFGASPTGAAVGFLAYAGAIAASKVKTALDSKIPPPQSGGPPKRGRGRPRKNPPPTEAAGE